MKTEVIMGGNDFDSLSADPLWELECCENRSDNGGATILIHYLHSSVCAICNNVNKKTEEEEPKTPNEQ